MIAAWLFAVGACAGLIVWLMKLRDESLAALEEARRILEQAERENASASALYDRLEESRRAVQ